MDSVVIADPKAETLTVKICGEDEVEDLLLSLFSSSTPTFSLNGAGELEATLRIVK